LRDWGKCCGFSFLKLPNNSAFQIWKWSLPEASGIENRQCPNLSWSADCPNPQRLDMPNGCELRQLALRPRRQDFKLGHYLKIKTIDEIGTVQLSCAAH
jgi:hypothetical protein